MLFTASRCWLCQSPLAIPRQGICGYCLRQLPPLPTCCPRCGLPSSHPKLACGRCLQQPPHWQSLVAVTDYIPPLRYLLHRFKFQGRSELARTLARLMLLAWLQARRQQRAIKPDLLLAVPLARINQWRRGFNQSERVTRHLAHWLDCPFEPQALTRTRITPSQRLLSSPFRPDNVRGAFHYAGTLDELNVLLIDDVVTTGSTVAEISRVLLAQGAQSVQICCLCRTLQSTEMLS